MSMLSASHAFQYCRNRPRSTMTTAPTATSPQLVYPGWRETGQIARGPPAVADCVVAPLSAAGPWAGGNPSRGNGRKPAGPHRPHGPGGIGQRGVRLHVRRYGPNGYHAHTAPAGPAEPAPAHGPVPGRDSVRPIQMGYRVGSVV